MIFKHLLLKFCLLFLISCAQQIQPKEITPVDLSILDEKALIGKSQSEINKLFKSLKQAALENTIGRKIPNLYITNFTTNEQTDLKTLTNQKTIVISSGVGCGFGNGYLFYDFPKVRDILKKDLEQWNTIILIQKDSLNSDSAHTAFATELKQHYKNVYTIHDSSAKRLNIISFPTTLYCNNNIVKGMHTGLIFDDNRNINTIKENLE